MIVSINNKIKFGKNLWARMFILFCLEACDFISAFVFIFIFMVLVFVVWYWLQLLRIFNNFDGNVLGINTWLLKMRFQAYKIQNNLYDHKFQIRSK